MDRVFKRGGIPSREVIDKPGQQLSDYNLWKSVYIMLYLSSYTPNLHELRIQDIPMSYKITQKFL